MVKYLLLFIFAAFAMRSAFLAMRMKFPPQYLLAAFWGLMALNQLTRLLILVPIAVICLAGYWAWSSVRRNKAPRDPQKQMGVSDMEIISIERIGREGDARKN
jgi:hypothetical protein